MPIFEFGVEQWWVLLLVVLLGVVGVLVVGRCVVERCWDVRYSVDSTNNLFSCSIVF